MDLTKKETQDGHKINLTKQNIQYGLIVDLTKQTDPPKPKIRNGHKMDLINPEWIQD